jgi:hypothetical protein
MFDRTRQPQMSAFFNEENDIAEEDESNTESSKQIPAYKMYQRPGFDEMDEKNLRSCVQDLRSAIDNPIPEQILIQIALKNQLNFEDALDDVMFNGAYAVEKLHAGKSCTVLLRKVVALTRVVTYIYADIQSTLSYPVSRLLKS